MYPLMLGMGFLISCFVLVFYLRHPAFSLFHPLTYYSAFHFIVFVIRPIPAYYLEFPGIYRAYGFYPSISDKITVIAAANLGYLVFAFFCLRAGNAPVIFRADSCTVEERRRLSQIFVWVVAICAPFAVYSLLRNLSVDTGDLVGIVLDRTTGVYIHTKHIGYLTTAQFMLVPICAIIAWLGRFRLISFVPLAAFAVIRGSTGGRGAIIAALVITLLLYLYEKRIRYPPVRLLIATVGMVMLFNMVGADRGAEIRQTIGIEEREAVFEQEIRTEKFMETMDLGNMEFFEYVVWVVPQQSATYDYFLNNFQLFTEPIPRLLWENKPSGAPFPRFLLWDYGTPIGMTMSLPGMGWFYMGWLGVVIWCGLWGHMLGALYRRYWEGDQSTLKTIAYMVFVATLIVAYRDGSSVTLAKQTSVYLAPVFVWFVLARYLGVARLSDLRLMMLKKMRLERLRQPLPPPDTAMPGALALSPPVNAEHSLPQAVRRRRAALKNGLEKGGLGSPAGG